MRIAARVLPALVAILAGYASAAQSSHGAVSIRRLDGSTIRVAEAESFARKTLENAHVTGAEIAVLNKGKLVWSQGFGVRSVNPDKPMNADTTTWAASITKSVFATYVMQLVERGEFDLDAPVVKQLPQPLDTYEPYRSTASELVKDPQWALVTPRLLLSHSSGLANFAFLEPDKKMHLHFRPGTEFRYSGEGINLVQFLVEQKKDKPVDALLQEAFFTPLQMTQTGMIYRKEFAANVADRFDRDGKFHAQTKRFPARAAGSMTSSVDDLSKFAEALFAGKLIRKKTMQSMLKPVIAIRSEHEFAIRANEGQGAEAANVGLAYGVGWGVLTKTKYGPAFFKEGHGDGAQNYMICFSKSKSCMVVLTNSDNGELAFRALFEKILGNTVTPWEWEGYTPEYIAESRKQAQ